jgi:hypothetical protein
VFGRKGPRGGTADASVLGADINSIDTSRHEATSGDKAAHFIKHQTTSNDTKRQKTKASGQRVIPQALPADPAKAEIDESWDRLPDDVKGRILAMVRAALKQGGAE